MKVVFTCYEVSHIKCQLQIFNGVLRTVDDIKFCARTHARARAHTHTHTHTH